MDAHEQLRSARHQLLLIHATLIASERREYERRRGVVTGGEFLQALINEPEFAWLHPLTALVAEIDELLDSDTPPANGIHDATLEQVRTLLRPDPSGNVFQRHYAEVLQHSPEAVVAHGAAMRELRSWIKEGLADRLA